MGLGYSFDFTYDDIDSDAESSVAIGSLLLDVHPLGDMFRIPTGGSVPANDLALERSNIGDDTASYDLAIGDRTVLPLLAISFSTDSQPTTIDPGPRATRSSTHRKAQANPVSSFLFRPPAPLESGDG